MVDLSEVVAVIELAEKEYPRERLRGIVPYAPRAHSANWVMVHGLAGLASHAAWHAIPDKLSIPFEEIKEKRAEILKDWYADVKKGLKAGKPVLEIIEGIIDKYEELTGESIVEARKHIPKAVMKLEQVFGLKIEKEESERISSVTEQPSGE